MADDVVSNVTEEPGLGQSREAFLEYVRLSFAGVPDARMELPDVVAEGIVVAARYRGSGTHGGESYADNLDLMQQFGALPGDVVG